MRRQVWISTHPNWWRRVHRAGSCRDYIHLQDKKEAIEKATEIARRMRMELKIARKWEEPRYWNTYWSNPFPPRQKEYQTIRCVRDPFPPRERRYYD